MHKNGKFIPLLALGFTFFLSGCDYFADKHLVEELKKQQKEQETKINLLEKQQKRTRSKDKFARKTTNYAYQHDPKGRRSRWPR